MRVSFVCLFLICAIATACDGDDGAVPTPSSRETSTVQPAATLTAPQDIPSMVPQAREPVVGADAPFPDNIALIVETGCWQCDGQATGLVRMYRDQTGELRVDRLSDDLGNFISFNASADGVRLTAAICVSGVCDGFNQPTPPPVIEKMMSEDGGITWTPLVADGGVVAALRDRLVLRTAAEGVAGEWRFVDYPSGAELVRPPLSDPATSPFAISPTELRWLAADGRALIYEDASVGYILDQTGAAGLRKEARINSALLDHDASSLFLSISSGAFNDGNGYLALTAPNDSRIRSMMVLNGGFYFGVPLTSTTLIANVDLPGPEFAFLPSIIDMEAYTVSPIREPFGTTAPFMRGRNFILGLMHGPFARVVSPGDCLNIRENAALSAPVLACAADGVLLHDEGVTRSSDGHAWRNVTTPAGVIGWADAEFLEVS